MLRVVFLRVSFLRVVMLGVVFSMGALLVVLMAPPVAAQEAPQATDVTSAEIQKFINALPRDGVSDRAIRVVKVSGDYQVWHLSYSNQRIRYQGSSNYYR